MFAISVTIPRKSTLLNIIYITIMNVIISLLHDNDELNSTLLAQAFQDIPSLSNNWSSALPWLADLGLHASSAISRISLCSSNWSCMNGSPRVLWHPSQTCYKGDSITKPRVPPSPSQHSFLWTNGLSFLKLPFLLEALIFQPQSSVTGLVKNVLCWLKLLAAGHLQKLLWWNDVTSLIKTGHGCMTCQYWWMEWIKHLPINDSVFQCFNPGAQCAADWDNLQTAFQHTKHSLPVAMNTDAMIAAIKQMLYPPLVPNSPFVKEPTCQQAALPWCHLLLKDVDLVAALKQVKSGTSPGPFADSTDLALKWHQ